jgi:hypothetical protein
MNWAGNTHPLERLAEWGAPLVLALAVAWAASLAGLPLAAKAAGGAAALAFGVAAMRIAGNAQHPMNANFEPAGFEAVEVADELLLDNPIDELLLDDPLVDPEPGSRVVRLFERQDPTPGELVLRISDYLGEQGRAPTAVEHQRVDASDALHAALANIRANLR